jgi:prepilin signal peptidase PulO-like enzyme (type II secretory pathway)
MMVGFLAALVPSTFLLATRGVAARKTAIPFAPFLAFGAVVAVFAGPAILDWYLGLTK